MLSIIMWLLRLYHAYIREILMNFLTHAQSKYLERCGKTVKDIIFVSIYKAICVYVFRQVHYKSYVAFLEKYK